MPCEFTGINILPGTFNVSVTDNVGTVQNYCVVLNNFTFPGAPNFTISNETCPLNNGTITFNPAGFAVTNIIWLDGGGNLVNIGANTITNLAPGNYTCIVYLTANGTSCQTTITPLTVLPWVPLTVTITPPASADCGGTASVIIAGGSGLLNYTWTGPSWMDFLGGGTGNTFPGSLSQTVSGGFGNISITVTDVQTGCTATANVNYTGAGCVADVDAKSFVNVNDLWLFMADYGSTSGGCSDFDGNGVVNINDLNIFIVAYGMTGC